MEVQTDGDTVVGTIRHHPALPRLFGVIIGIGMWHGMASVFPNQLMPFPLETLELTWGLVQSGVAFKHMFWTYWRSLWGFLGAFAIALVLGVAIGTSSFGKKFFTPYIVVGLSFPAITWAAATVLIFGFSELAPVTATILIVFPYITINIWKGIENIDWSLVQMSETFNVSKVRLLRRLILPNIASSLFSAVRLGLAMSWKLVTIAEIFASSEGIGYKLIQSYERYQFELAWAWAVLFMIVILAIEYGVFRPIERRVFEYRRDVQLSQIR